LTNVYIADSLRHMLLPRTLLALILLTTVSVALATTYAAPKRKLEPVEKVASTVGDSPFIAVGRIVAGYDTVVANGNRPGAFAVVLFEPVRVLRGPSPGRLRVVFWKSSDVAVGGRPGERKIWPASYLPSSLILACFEDISKYRVSNPVRLGGAAAGVSHWAASDNFHPYSVPRLEEWNDSLETVVRNEVRDQEPEVLAHSAERIVLAQPTTDGKRWTVSRTFKGEKASTIDVRMIVPHEFRKGDEALLFLQRLNGEWEPIRFRAGLVAVRGAQVPRWSCSLDEAIARITR